MSRIREFRATSCYSCSAPLDHAESMARDDGGRPRPVASVCLFCGAIAVLGENLELQRPPRSVLDEMFADQEFVRMWAEAMRARCYAVAVLGDSMVRYHVPAESRAP